MKIKLFTTFFLTLLTMLISPVKSANKTSISYSVTFPEAAAHYLNIEMDIKGVNQKFIELKMPVWTPGSYLIREFAKNIETFNVYSEGKVIPFQKTSKNCWKIWTSGIKTVTVSYKVYCFEMSVRTSFVDASHAFLCNTGVFLYPANMLKQPSTIKIVPYNGWTIVSTSLERVNGNPFVRKAPNYDILFDSPIEIGNQDVFGFDAAGVKYEVAMCGGGNYDKERLKKDMAKIIEEETSIFGENPNKYYLFIVHNSSRAGGGLEHLSSTTLGAFRDVYSSESGYQNFLGLVAHEHFHLWNVKRLRPIALGPFDYEKENYTTNLWIAEGFTAYYQNLILRHANLYPPDSFLTSLAGQINNVIGTPGARVQTVAESSFDAWIKAYRPNENSANTTISYYDKGAIIGLLLDLKIINNSNGKYSLNDVMKYMYQTFYKDKKRGYTDAEFKNGLEKFSNESLDEFYKNYINGLSAIDFNKYLGYAGYKVTDELENSNDPTLGVNISTGNGKNFVTAVFRDGPGWIDGVNVGDEITDIDGNTAIDIAGYLKGKKVGDTVEIGIKRDGLPLKLKVNLLRNSRLKLKIESISDPTPHQIMVRNKWLKITPAK